MREAAYRALLGKYAENGGLPFETGRQKLFSIVGWSSPPLQNPSRRSFYLPESAPHYAPSRDFHVEHVRIELDIDFERRAIAGSCTLDVRPVREGLDRVALDACEMSVESVGVDGVPAEFDYDGERLTVRLLEEARDRRSVKVAYSCVPREGVYFISPDAQHPEKPLQAWTHGEAQLARFWYPCYDYPNDKCTSETVITVPKGYTVVSNGELVSKSESGEKIRFHWKENKPHASYLTSFVAGEFGRSARWQRGSRSTTSSLSRGERTSSGTSEKRRR